jgi:hypothetical protein
MFPGHFLIRDLSPVCNYITTTGVATVYPSGTPEFTPICFRCSCYSTLVLCFLCFVDRCFSFCTCCLAILLFFFDIQNLITLWDLQTLLKVQRSKFDRNNFLYYETLPLYCLSSFHCIVCHPSIVLSVILPLYFLSSFHMWLSNTLLVCSRISQ